MGNLAAWSVEGIPYFSSSIFEEDALESASKPEHPAHIAAQFLQSAEFHRVWSEFHPSKSMDDKNPLHQASHHALNWANGYAGCPEEVRELSAFLRQLMLILHRASEAHGVEGPQTEGRKKTFDKIAGSLNDLGRVGGEEPLMREDISNPHYREILNVAERHFMQRKIDPVRSAKEFFADVIAFFKKKIADNPRKSVPIMAAYLGLVAFITHRLPTSTPIEAGSQGIQSFEIDDEGNVVGMEYEKPTLEDLESVKEASHGDLVWLVPDAWVDTVRESEFLSSLLPHFSQVKDLAWKANAWVNDGTELIRDYTFDIGVTDPVSLGINMKYLADTAWMRGYEWMTPIIADFWYSYNMFENVVLHPAFLTAAFGAVIATGLLKYADLKEAKNSIGDFFSRVWNKRALTAGFSLAASGAAFVVGGNELLNPSILWAAIGGGILGHYADKFWFGLSKKGQKSLNAMTRGVDDLLTRFNAHSQAKPYSEQPSREKVSKLWRNFLYANLATTVTSLSALGVETTGLIDVIQNPHMKEIAEGLSSASGAALAVQLTTFAFIHYNIPDEIVQHRAWAGAGVVLGAACLPLVAGYRFLRGRRAEPVPVDENARLTEANGYLSYDIMHEDHHAGCVHH